MGRLVIQWFRKRPRDQAQGTIPPPVGTHHGDPLYRIEEADPETQCILGTSYASGKGVPLDYGAAMRCYRLAAEQQFARAQFHLGELYAIALHLLA